MVTIPKNVKVLFTTKSTVYDVRDFCKHLASKSFVNVL